MSVQVKALEDALAGKADRGDVLTTLGALQTMLLTKMDRSEAEQLLARKLDIRTFLASQGDAPSLPRLASAPPSDRGGGTPREAAAAAAPYPGIGLETASAADLLRSTAPPLREGSDRGWVASGQSGGASKGRRISGFGAAESEPRSTDAGRLATVRPYSETFLHSCAALVALRRSCDACRSWVRLIVAPDAARVRSLCTPVNSGALKQRKYGSLLARCLLLTLLAPLAGSPHCGVGPPTNREPVLTVYPTYASSN